MSKIRVFVDAATAAYKWGASIVAVLMMLVIACAVVARALGTPLPADVEVIQLTMGTLVMLGLAYTEQVQSHVTVGLLVDHMPPRWQAALDLIAVALICAACAVIGWVNLTVAVEYLTVRPRSTDYLSIPLWPFKLIIGFGFWLWALQAVLRVPEILRNAREGVVSIRNGGHA